MANLCRVFHGNDLDTILDSLDDAAENCYNASDAAADHEAQEQFSREGDRYSLIHDRLAGGLTIHDDDLDYVVAALEASETNCVDLGLMPEADEYGRLKNLVKSLAFEG